MDTEERPEDTARRQPLQAPERGLRRDHTAGTWISGSEPPGCEEVNVSPGPQLVVICSGGPSNLTPTTLSVSHIRGEVGILSP